MTGHVYDLAVIGGGINGAGIAADAAGRGLSVVLLEKCDLAGGTSSASSKLIHGGLRYLETYELRLVREALAERDVLLAKAGHIVWPLRFVLPHVPGMRPAMMIRAGLFLYDHLARRQRIPGSSSLDLARDPAGAALRPELNRGFAYWDCWVDDARLVVLNARAAAASGARIVTRARVRQARPEDGAWHVTVEGASGPEDSRARVLVNAAGPWAGPVMDLCGRPESGPERAHTRPKLRLVKGSHIVVPRLAGGDAYLMQNDDRRAVFAIPFEDRFTLIGTTDVPYEGDPGGAAIDEHEEDYLLAVTRRFFRKPVERKDIVWRYAGVRPLIDDGSANPSAVSRDYQLELEAGPGAPPVLHVLGGKVTTYRRLAEAALERLKPHLSLTRGPWTAAAPLPGGDFGAKGVMGYRLDLERRRPGLPAALLSRLVRRYGTLADDVLGDARTPADLGLDLGGGLSEREVLYLKEQEWARSPDDVLWRRTKAGLHMSEAERKRSIELIARLL
jgi:glycerol-3-phosphate dehydrogenase